MAGMGVGSALHIISEPEAAAMFALDAMDPHNIKVGDTFVLCDAGGGTVDLISYKVSALKPLLKISEAAPGSGSSCGSTYLNRIFQKFLKEKLGSDSNWDEDVMEEAMRRFELTVKRAFNGSPGEEYQIPVPGLRDSVTRDVRRGRFRLVGSDIAATKDPVKAVLLVGGFGQSGFLRDQVRQAGDLVEENMPKRLSYSHTLPISEGPPSRIKSRVWAYNDVDNSGAPLLRTAAVSELVVIIADFKRIPTSSFPTSVGKDHVHYYRLWYDIEITYFSAYTKYELIYDGKNYGPLHAEYV
ncbi:MAG: hypothetical protein Q9195_006885 [Heterodermia aff. obscurata]